MLNSGTILGTRQGLRRFLDVLVGEFLANKQKTHNKCQSVSDQWTMNWLYYNGRFGAYSKTATIPWGFGPIMTAGKVCWACYSIRSCILCVMHDICCLGMHNSRSEGRGGRYLDETRRERTISESSRRTGRSGDPSVRSMRGMDGEIHQHLEISYRRMTKWQSSINQEDVTSSILKEL